MAWPVYQRVLPANLVNVSNGNLPSDLLVSVNFPGRKGARLHFQTARCWYAMADACQKHTGATLTVVSSADAYRSYANQLSTFLARYEPVSFAVYAVTRPSFRRNFSYGSSKYWKLRAGMSPSATPGSSNHGLGIAIDVGVLTGDGRIIGVYGSAAWDWFLAHAVEYGFSWEDQIEPWHVRMFTGDKTPAAVLAFENGNGTAPPVWPPFAPEQAQWGLWPLAEKPRIGTGAQGEVVRYLQGVIFWKGGGNITIDGDYGPQTAQRVRDLQAWFGAYVDGWTGPETWHLIDVLAVQ